MLLTTIQTTLVNSIALHTTHANHFMSAGFREAWKATQLISVEFLQNDKE